MFQDLPLHPGTTRAGRDLVGRLTSKLGLWSEPFTLRLAAAGSIYLSTGPPRLSKDVLRAVMAMRTARRLVDESRWPTLRMPMEQIARDAAGPRRVPDDGWDSSQQTVFAELNNQAIPFCCDPAAAPDAPRVAYDHWSAIQDPITGGMAEGEKMLPLGDQLLALQIASLFSSSYPVWRAVFLRLSCFIAGRCYEPGGPLFLDLPAAAAPVAPELNLRAARYLAQAGELLENPGLTTLGLTVIHCAVREPAENRELAAEQLAGLCLAYSYRPEDRLLPRMEDCVSSVCTTRKTELPTSFCISSAALDSLRSLRGLAVEQCG